MQAGADPSTYTFSGNSGQNKTNLGGGTIPEQKGAPALDMSNKSKKKDGALPDLVLVFDIQSRSQRLVSEADIKKEKGRYLRVKPAATDAVAVVTPTPTAKVVTSPLPAAAAAPVISKALSSEMIMENGAAAKSTDTAEKVKNQKNPKTQQYYTGDFFVREVNKKTVVMTPEVNKLYEEYKIPFTSNIRTQAEQTALIDQEKSKKAGRPVTKLGYPVADISDHFTGNAVDISLKGLTKEMKEILAKNGWYRPFPTSDPVHWIKNPNFKADAVLPPLEKKDAAPPAVNSAPTSVPVPAPAKLNLGFNTPDITSPKIMSPTLLASNDYNSLSSNDVMTGLLLKQISSLNMDQKKVNKMQPIVLVNNSTNMIGSSRKETIVTPTHPDYNAYSPYA